MATARRRGSARRASTETKPDKDLDLRPRPEDRVVATEQEESRARRRRPPTLRWPRRTALKAAGPGRGNLGAQPRGWGGGLGGRGRSRGWLLRRALYWALVLGLWAVIAAVGVVMWVGAHLPPIQSLEVPKRPPSVEIVGRDGRVIATRGEMGGAAVPLKELPPYLPQAFIAIEDRRFYSHHGIDAFGIARALVANLVHRGVSQGGSTLTQQLAKNLFLTQERTYLRKLQEVALALWLERKLIKAQILDLYLNRVYFGVGAYGVEAAAQRYFGKSARQVTLAEAALLAGLVRSPSRLAPTRNPDGAERRARIVLAAMVNAGFISSHMAQNAAGRSPRIATQMTGGSGNYVADWVMDDLDDLVGHVEQDLVVSTAIDPALQAAAERALVEQLDEKGQRFGVGQGAVVAMSPNGAVRALVGGRNYADSQYDRAVAAKRQPGSAFKPFVYLTALEHGLTPDTIREDRPIELNGWRPENYGHHYLGPVTLTRALAMSLNTVSVRLTLEVGAHAVVRTAHRLGIASRLDANPSIALGTSEVSLLELVSAYAPFANGGMAVVPHVIERVRTLRGQTLYVAEAQMLGRVVDARAVAMMNTMMHETLTTGTARRAEAPPGWFAGGKTGTSQDFRDAWFIGYTTHLVTGVWLGNDDNAPTRKMTGGGLPAEIWSRFMRTAHQGLPVPTLAGPLERSPEVPAPISGSGSNTVLPQASAVRPAPAIGIDSWLLDRLFGRH
jgi:penicillin-binding protein 1A